MQILCNSPENSERGFFDYLPRRMPLQASVRPLLRSPGFTHSLHKPHIFIASQRTRCPAIGDSQIPTGVTASDAQAQQANSSSSTLPPTAHISLPTPGTLELDSQVDHAESQQPSSSPEPGITQGPSCGSETLPALRPSAITAAAEEESCTE